jgi:hypothetical protein
MLTPVPRNANPRVPVPRALPRHRRARLRQGAPRPEFRDPFVEHRLDFAVDLAGGGCRSLLTLIEGDDR